MDVFEQVRVGLKCMAYQKFVNALYLDIQHHKDRTVRLFAENHNRRSGLILAHRRTRDQRYAEYGCFENMAITIPLLIRSK